MNKPAVVLYSEMTSDERQSVLDVARKNISAIPKVQMKPGSSIELDVNQKQNLVCISFKDKSHIIQAANGMMFQNFLDDGYFHFLSEDFCTTFMGLGDFLISFGDVIVNKPVVHETTFVDDDETKLHNGLYNVKNRVVNYRGYSIVPKLDFGDHAYRSHANVISTGWIVTKDGCNAMPGATWDASILACRASIDIWIESDFNTNKYWELMEAYRY